MRKWRALAGAALVVGAVLAAAVAGERASHARGTAVAAYANARLAASGPAFANRAAGRRGARALPGSGTLTFNGVSPPLSTLPVSAPSLVKRDHEPGLALRGQPVPATDPVVQTAAGSNTPAPSTSVSFDGICSAGAGACTVGSNCVCLPPDTNGEAGLDQYVQMVNNSLAVYAKSDGSELKAATDFNSLWQSAGGFCADAGNSDPIVIYDQLANRWLISELEASQLGASTNGECIAVSTSSDAKGTYNLYSLDTGGTLLDYPKFGLWPTGYFMTANEFPPNQQLSQGVAAIAFERDKMLQGQAARYVYYDEGAKSTQATFFAGQLPGDLDGSNLPPTGAPDVVVGVDDCVSYPNPNCATSPTDPNNWALRVWKFAVDWSTNPPTSSFGTGSTPPSGTTPGVGGDPNFTVPVAQFVRASANSCVYGETFPNCIPQYNGVAGPAPQGLDILGDRLMFRAAYRNFGANPPSGIPANTQSLTLNLSVQVVDTNNLPRIGIRWMEVRNPLGVSGSPSIYQQGTYALADATTHPLWRWMGSVAMDHAGDVALGFSTSGPNDYPTIRYAGRLATDPPASLGTLTQTEVTIPSGPRSVAYGGPQTEPEGRWGDYSDMTIDPVNDCTFWYTQEYLETLFVVIGNWRTRVGAFRFANCTFSPTAVAVNAFSARWTRAGATIAWRTAEETDALGFNVYRVNARGALTRVNPTLIRARHSGRTTGALYRFLDRGATRRNATTYKLQLVDLQGKRSWYGVGTTP